MPPEMLPLVLVRVLIETTRPGRDLPVAGSVIVTAIPGLTSLASAGLSWPMMPGLPIDRVTSDPLAVPPTFAPRPTTEAGKLGTNMNSDSGTLAPWLFGRPAGGAEYPMFL